MEHANIDRRHFLAGIGATALLGTLSAAAGCAPAPTGTQKEGPSAKPVSETWDCDIVIVGAGGSGLAAAVEAGEAGARVICLERESVAGGGAVGVEGCFGVGSRMQKEAGIVVSTGAVVRHELESSQQRANGRALVNIVHKSAENLDWLMDHGVSFGEVIGEWAGENMAVFHRYSHGAGSEDYVPPMLAAAEAAGVEFHYNTLANELIQSEDGTITGVYAEDEKGNRIQINAAATILATGGFCEDLEMVAQSGINVADANYVGMPGHDGTGHRMAIAAGAADNMRSTAYLAALAVNGLPGYFEGGKFSFMIGIQSPYCVWLNQDAQRFVNEDFSATNAMIMTVPTWPNKSTYIMMDAAMIQRYMNGDKEAEEQLQAGLENGNIVSADTVEQLAPLMAMDATALAETIARYNDFCDAGDDGDFGKAPDMLMTMQEPPFYGFHVVPEVQVAIGSIVTDLDSRALSPDGTPIEGLYVTGVEGAMLWANVYTFDVPCECNANNVNSGRAAAKHALGRLGS